jgi:hypothetical protein
MKSPTAFETGVQEPARRWAMAERLLAELVKVKDIDEREFHALEPTELMHFELAVGPDARHMTAYDGRTLDQRIDIAFATACEVVDGYRDFRFDQSADMDLMKAELALGATTISRHVFGDA